MKTKPVFSLKKISRRERGQSLAELALVMVVLLILLAGVVDLGRMMFEFLSMRDAAQEGISYGVIYPNQCFQVEDRVRNNLTGGAYTVVVLVNGANCDPNATPADVCSGDLMEVTVDTVFQISMPFLSAFTGTSVPLRASVTDMIVRPSCP